MDQLAGQLASRLKAQAAERAKWLTRVLIMLAVVSFPMVSDLDVQRLHTAFPPAACATANQIDQAGLVEQLHHAYEWNRLLDKSFAAVNQNYFSIPNVLANVQQWTPLITCLARVFDLPPELLAGVLALEIDLDYHFVDAVADGLMRSSVLGDVLSPVVMGAGYAGVHFSHLKLALATFGADFSPSPVYQIYYRIVIRRSIPELTLLATRDPLIDIADAAVMTRYYALLRLGGRPMSSLTLTDMAFIWSAYRGGVKNTPADLPDKRDYRWSVAYLQSADNPRILGDSLVALPYFTYYQAVFSR